MPIFFVVLSVFILVKFCFITSHNSALLQTSTNKYLLLEHFIFIYFHPLYHLCHHYLLLTHFTCCLMRLQSAAVAANLAFFI